MTKCWLFVLNLLLGLMFCDTYAFATPIQASGQFSISGTVYVAQTEFLFGYYATPSDTSADQKGAILLPSQDIFGTLRAGEIVGIKNLLTPANGGTFGPGPVVPGSPFLLQKFITLPDGINIDLTGLPVSSDVPVCTGAAIPNGSNLTCLAQAGSPIILAQNSTGVTAILNLSGRAHTAGAVAYTPVVGKIAANFTSGADATIAGLLNDFATNGSIETSYSANLSTVSASPEPGSLSLLLMIGIGCAGVGLYRRRT